MMSSPAKTPEPKRKPKLRPRLRPNAVDLKDEDEDADRMEEEELLEADNVAVEEEDKEAGVDNLLTAAPVTSLVLAVEVVGNPLPRIRILGSTLCHTFARKICFLAVFSSFPRNDARKMRTLSATKTSVTRQKRA
jgi:hypothetical protein